MILIGMFDSPFVRRVAVSMTLLDIAFEHRNWSVGKDIAKIQGYNPLGRVPTLVLDNGDSLMESSAILDFLDEIAGKDRALLPPGGPQRRSALKIMAVATGTADKGVAQIYEQVFRPADKRHEPWIERCSAQMHAGLAELERYAAKLKLGDWLVGSSLTQADVTVSCVVTFLTEAKNVNASMAAYPALTSFVARCEALAAFKAVKGAWSPPAPA